MAKKRTNGKSGASLWPLAKAVFQGKAPGQAVIQITDRCNAQCAQCSMRASNPFQRTSLGVDQVKALIDDMAERGVQSISFTGGEPLLLLDEVAELARHARSAGIPLVRTGTNGFIFLGHDRPNFKSRIAAIAETLVESGVRNFWISLDSANPAIHESNRGLPGVVAGIAKGLSVFHDHGLYPAANLGVNRYTGGLIPELQASTARYFNPDSFHGAFCRALRRFYDFVENLGFTMVNACYPMSHDSGDAPSDAVYSATSSHPMIHFTATEKLQIFRALYTVIPEVRPRMRVFTPRSSLLALIRQCAGEAESPPCRGGVDFFFVDCKEMNTYPCGYRGDESLGPFYLAAWKGRTAEPRCRRCEWECFRDPSTLFHPLASLSKGLFTAAREFVRDREFASAWREDLMYYRACDWFNGREDSDLSRLSAFRPTTDGARFRQRLFKPA